MEETTEQMFGDVKSVGASSDKTVPDMAVNALLAGIFLNSWSFLRGMFIIMTEYFSSFVIIPLHFDFGERKFNILFIFFGMIGLQIFGLFVDGYNTIGNLTGRYYDFGLFIAYSKFYFTIGLAHYLHLLYRRYRQPTKLVHSQSNGSSWLYFLFWAPLCKRFNFKIFTGEGDFQKWVEPLFIILCGAFIRYFLELNIGGFFMLCGLFTFIRIQMVEDTMRSFLLDIMDGQILNRRTASIMRGSLDVGPDEGLKLTHVMMNEIQHIQAKNVENRQKPSEQDTELFELMQKQKLDE